MPENPYHHGDLRNQLVAETRSLVEREGVAAVTLARVARQCGVSVAAPYRHFANKEELLGAVAATGFDELRGELQRAATGADPADRLVGAGVAYVEFGVSHPHLFAVMFDADARERQHRAGPAAREALAELVRPLQPAVPVEVAVRATWALAHGLAMLRIGGMLSFTTDDTTARLREELQTVLTGITDHR